jgi:two-component system, OmpR family, sensor histidine kinase TctE
MNLWPHTNSIRRRLVIQLAAVAAILALAFLLVVRVLAQSAAQDTQDNILAASATAIADALYAANGQVRLELPYSAISMLGTISQDRVFYRVAANGQTLTGYGDLPGPAGISRASEAAFSTYDYRGEPVRAASVLRPVSVGTQPVDVTVTVAQTQLGLAAISSRITSVATAIAVGFFLAATALGLLAARSALAPLDRMTQAVARRGPGDLRPVVTDTPTELIPLVDALNQFISRLAASLTRSEDLIAEAAHRVRTPLATVRAQAEITHHRLKKPEHRQAIREMIRAIDESSRSAGQLLDHAMVTFRTDSLEREQLDLGELLTEVCDRLAPTAELKDIEIIRDIPPAPLALTGDRILLLSALRNILDNAIKYSPADSTITASAKGGDDIRLSIRDSGRGFGDTDTQKLTSRFSRGTNVSDIVGSGLGLTIADEVARSHGGRLEIAANNKGGGAWVSLVFPVS